MADTAARIDILIDIKARLDELVKATAGLRQVGDEANSASSAAGGFFGQFRQGLGLGAGLFTIASGVAIVKNTIKETIGEALRMAAAVKDGAANLGISTDGYQTLNQLVKTTGGDLGALTGALNTQQRTLLEAANNAIGPAAAAYERLGLSVTRMQGLSLERQFEAIARSIANASNKQEAFRSAAILLGERNLPRLRAALQELGTEGYDAVKQKADAAIMSPTAIATLAAATDAWKRAKDIFVAKVGEDFAGLLNLFGVKGELPQPRAKTGDELRAAEQLANQQQELAAAQASLSKAQLTASNIGADVALTELERKQDLDKQYDRIIAKLTTIIALRKAMPLDLTGGETQAKRDDEIRKLDAELSSAQNAARANLGLGPTNYATRKNAQARDEANLTPHELAMKRGTEVNDPSKNPDFITGGQGFMEGFANWSSQVGTVGQQISQTLTGTIGGAISTVSQGITGLITGTASWGDVGRSVGLMFLQTLIQVGVQMAAQQVITWALAAAHSAAEVAKTAATAAGASARTTAVVAEAGTEATVTGIAAVFRSIMELGPIAGPLVFVAGIAAMIALVSSLTKGFRIGGYTGDGAPDEVAGVAHKGEVIFSQADVARHGGAAAVDRFRVMGGSTAAGGATGRAGGVSSAMPVQEAKRERSIVFTGDLMKARNLMRDSDWDNVFIDASRRNRGEVLA